MRIVSKGNFPISRLMNNRISPVGILTFLMGIINAKIVKYKVFCSRFGSDLVSSPVYVAIQFKVPFKNEE